MENCWNYISMYHRPLNAGRRYLIVINVMHTGSECNKCTNKNKKIEYYTNLYNKVLIVTQLSTKNMTILPRKYLQNKHIWYRKYQCVPKHIPFYQKANIVLMSIGCTRNFRCTKKKHIKKNIKRKEYITLKVWK